MITLEAFELRRVRMPLVAPFGTSFGTIDERDVLIVRAVAAEGEGWGECVALPTPVYSPEDVQGAHRIVREYLAPRLLEVGAVTAAGVAPALAMVKGNPMAKAAIEAAIFDAELRASGTSMATALGATRAWVDCGVSIGTMGSVTELLGAVEGYVAAGYRRIKLKIKPGWDVEPVRAVRERFPEVPLQVDANTAYAVADARHLARLDDFDLLLIEQPLPERDIRGHAALARQIRTPVCLDESIESAADAADAIERGACAIVNIKAGRVGGYLEARRIHDVCLASGAPVWCGGMLETGIGRAANLALAALPGFTLPGDTSASDRYYRQDITEPFVLDDGRLPVPTAPGIGVDPLPDVLGSVTTSVELVKR